MFRPIRRRADTAPDPSSHAAIRIGLVGSEYSGKTEVLTTLLSHRIQTNTPQDYILQANDEIPVQTTLLFDVPSEPEEELLKWCDWSECYILCFSVSVRESFDEIIRLRESIRRAKKTKHVPPTLILGTSFGVKARVVEYDEASKLAKQLNFQYTEVSRNAFHISEAIRIIVKSALQFRASPDSMGTVRRGVRTENVDALQKRGKLKEEVSSFEKWDETLDQIAKRVTKNPQQFENKAEVLRRFLEGEREYGEKLTLAVKIFYRPLVTANPPILKRKNMQKIFRNIEVIVGQTVSFVNALYQRVFEEWQLGNETVADLVEMLCSLVKLNEAYLQNHIASVTCVNNMEKKNINFADFLQRSNASSEAVAKKLDFIGFLLLPVERLRKYERVVEALQTHTPEGHLDFAVLNTVAAAIAATKNIVQVKMEENFQLVFSIQRSFVGDFVIAKEYSYFITDGPLMKVCKSGERKLRWFFLFNDSLVYATVIPAPTLPSIPDPPDSSAFSKNISSLSLQPYKGNVYAISRKITLGIACKIVDMSNAAGFKIISVEKTFVVFAPSLAEKKKWLEQFLTVLSDDCIVDDGRSKSTYELSPAAHASVKIKQCMMCSKIINEAKHYWCRNCGKVICAACSTKRYRVSHIGGDDSTVRVCDYCHQYLSLSMDDDLKPSRTPSQPRLGESPENKSDGFSKTASLVGYSLKKMRNVGQFVKRKTQVLDLFKRKKPAFANRMENERPTNVTIGNPVVNNNVVVMSNPIINQYNHTLHTDAATPSSPLSALSSSPISIFAPPLSTSKPAGSFVATVAPNHGVFINSGGTLGRPRKDVRNSISQEEAQHLEQNLKQKIHHINQAIQKQQRENPRPIPPPRGAPHIQAHSTSPASTSPVSASPPVVTNPPPPLSLNPPRSASPPKPPAARRFGVKFESPMEQPEFTNANTNTNTSTSTNTNTTASLQKTRPEVPAKPLPSRPSISVTHTAANQINLWKCLPDEASHSPLSSPPGKQFTEPPSFSSSPPKPPSSATPSNNLSTTSSIKPKPPSNPPPKPPASKLTTTATNPPVNPVSNPPTSKPLSNVHFKPPSHTPPVKPPATSSSSSLNTNPLTNSAPIPPVTSSSTSTSTRPRVPARTLRGTESASALKPDATQVIDAPGAGKPARPSREAPARPVRPPRKGSPSKQAAHMTYPRNRGSYAKGNDGDV